jgi:hypothetical protein
MTDCWGTDNSLCDIGPIPFGDGIIDIEDLKALARFIGEDIDDPTLIAHWTLDEAGGDVAHDIASGHDAVVLGGATWRPEEGALDGALGFDGIDTYVETPAIVNPATGSVLAFAWIKGGIAGGVILSQANGHNWLLTDATGGLMTDLKGSGRKAQALYSGVVVTDGHWHRVGLKWDGVNRTLYVDDITVAEDEPGLPPDVYEGFHIGAGATLGPDSFFSGLIDDVRIYNRVVRP